jgi:hypothetical protein
MIQDLSIHPSIHNFLSLVIYEHHAFSCSMIYVYQCFDADPTMSFQPPTRSSVHYFSRLRSSSFRPSSVSHRLKFYFSLIFPLSDFLILFFGVLLPETSCVALLFYLAVCLDIAGIFLSSLSSNLVSKVQAPATQRHAVDARYSNTPIVSSTPGTNRASSDQLATGKHKYASAAIGEGTGTPQATAAKKWVRGEQSVSAQVAGVSTSTPGAPPTKTWIRSERPSTAQAAVVGSSTSGAPATKKWVRDEQPSTYQAVAAGTGARGFTAMKKWVRRDHPVPSQLPPAPITTAGVGVPGVAGTKKWVRGDQTAASAPVARVGTVAAGTLANKKWVRSEQSGPTTQVAAGAIDGVGASGLQASAGNKWVRSVVAGAVQQAAPGSIDGDRSGSGSIGRGTGREQGLAGRHAGVSSRLQAGAQDDTTGLGVASSLRPADGSKPTPTPTPTYVKQQPNKLVRTAASTAPSVELSRGLTTLPSNMADSSASGENILQASTGAPPVGAVQEPGRLGKRRSKKLFKHKGSSPEFSQFLFSPLAYVQASTLTFCVSFRTFVCPCICRSMPLFEYLYLSISVCLSAPLPVSVTGWLFVSVRRSVFFSVTLHVYLSVWHCTFASLSAYHFLRIFLYVDLSTSLRLCLG